MQGQFAPRSVAMPTTAAAAESCVLVPALSECAATEGRPRADQKMPVRMPVRMPDPTLAEPSVNRLAFLDQELSALSTAALLRENISLEGPVGARVKRGGRTLLNFSSNDYLSLANHPGVKQAAAATALEQGAGAGASRLLGGDLPIHRALEAALAEFKGTEAALLFASGSLANLGIIPALVGAQDAVFSDALNHASIIDGCRLSRADRFIYRHLDLAQLTEQLGASHAHRKLIVSESLFSMDGDVAPLAALCDLAERFDALLMIDEAHATGVHGEGVGLCRALGIDQRVPIQMGTLGKALGSAGAYVAGERRLVQFLLNRARTYVFSTAPSPASCGAALEALRLVRTPEGRSRRKQVLARAAELAAAIRLQGLPLIGGESQLMAVAVPDPGHAVATSAALEADGFLVRAVRPPTVPEGASRLRICVAADHSAADVAALAKTLAHRLSARPPIPSAVDG